MAGAVYAISRRSFSESEYRLSPMAFTSFLQASQRDFTSAASSGSGGFLSIPSRGKMMGRISLALSQPMFRRRCSSRMVSPASDRAGR